MKFLDNMFQRDRLAFDILTEAVKYDEMFKDVIAFADKHGPSTIEQQVKATVASARKVLRKQDRIVWFLRWAKVEIVEEIVSHAERKGDTADEAKLLASKVYADVGRKVGIPADAVPRAMTDYARHLLHRIEHFLSLPIHAITSTVFAQQTPSALIAAFTRAEDAWKKEAEDAFPEDDNRVEALIEFPDGFGWYMLNKAYCSKEAKAMGHCGNSPRQYSSDNILSLRKKIVRGETTLMKPYATFILTSDGQLTEMKGRFNEKPSRDLHPYIVDLLRLDIIHGIRGGGYMAQNNFSLYDLDDDVREELVDEKPELEGFAGLYRKHGATTQVLYVAEEMLQEARMSPPVFQIEGDEIVLQTWTDLERFARDAGDYMLQALCEAYENMKEGENLEVSTLDDEDIYDVIKALNTSEYRSLMAALGLEAVSPNSDGFHRSIRRAATELRNSVLFDDLLTAAAQTSTITDDVLEKMRDRIVEYLEAGLDFEGNIQYITYDEENPIDGNVHLKVGARELCDMVADHHSGEDDDYSEGSYNWDAIKSAGDWTTLSDYVHDRRREAGLSVDMGHDASADSDEEIAKLLQSGMQMNLSAMAEKFARLAGL